MDFQYFSLEHLDQISIISFGRPAKANSMNLDCWKEFPTVFEFLSERKATRAIILAGNERHFCAGMDLEALMNLQQFTGSGDDGKRSEMLRKFILGLQASITAIEACDKPVLAAVGGKCIGAGVDIISACDIRLSAAQAGFCIKEIDMGMVADMGTLQRLPKIISPGWATQLALTGETIDGHKAKEIGLVNTCYDDYERLMTGAQQLAQTIAEKSPQSIRGTKRMLLYARDHTVADGLEMMAVWNSAHLISNDLMTAFQSAMTKEKPSFED